MQIPRSAALALVLAVPVLGVLDYWSGPDFGFSLFYLVPVAIAAWEVAGALAIVLAVLGAAAWLTADVAYHGPTLVAAWNGFTRLTMYIAVAALTQRVRRDRAELASLNTRLASLLDHERELSRTDALTGLGNVRMFDDALLRAAARNDREGTPIAVALFDLDHFKLLNDTRGHVQGDAALRSAGAALRAVMRAGDVAARLGGDEFGALFHDCDETAARAAGTRALEAIVAALEPFSSGNLGATGGIACFERLPADRDAIMAVADAALYRAKSEGRGRISISRAAAAG